MKKLLALTIAVIAALGVALKTKQPQMWIKPDRKD